MHADVYNFYYKQIQGTCNFEGEFSYNTLHITFVETPVALHPPQCWFTNHPLANIRQSQHNRGSGQEVQSGKVKKVGWEGLTWKIAVSV